MSFFNILYFLAHNSNLSRHELCPRKFKKLNNDIFYILSYVKPTLEQTFQSILLLNLGHAWNQSFCECHVTIFCLL